MSPVATLNKAADSRTLAERSSCLVVEDQLMFQQLLIGMLKASTRLHVLPPAGTASEAIASCATHRPDLVILDLMLPDGDGLTVARALQVLNPSARVILLSSYASTFERPAELREVITAVIDKARAFQDLLDEVHSLLPGEPAALEPGSEDLNHLSSRERQVLQLIGEGQTSAEIAAALQITRRTVEAHRRNITTKLGLRGAALVHQATLLRQQS